MFFEDWAYYGFLTILVEAILYLSFKLVVLEFREYHKRKFFKKHPELKALVDEATSLDIPRLTAEEIDDIPLPAYLLYNPDNFIPETSAIFVTRARAESEAEDGDVIMELGFFTPSNVEQAYLQTQHFRNEHALLIHKLYTYEDEDDESSTE